MLELLNAYYIVPSAKKWIHCLQTVRWKYGYVDVCWWHRWRRGMPSQREMSPHWVHTTDYIDRTFLSLILHRAFITH